MCPPCRRTPSPPWRRPGLALKHRAPAPPGAPLPSPSPSRAAAALLLEASTLMYLPQVVQEAHRGTTVTPPGPAVPAKVRNTGQWAWRSVPSGYPSPTLGARGWVAGLHLGRAKPGPRRVPPGASHSCSPGPLACAVVPGAAVLGRQLRWVVSRADPQCPLPHGGDRGAPRHPPAHTWVACATWGSRATTAAPT
jgi:hypothetical protein